MSRTNIRYLEVDPTAAGDATVTPPTGYARSDGDIINGHSTAKFALLEHNSWALDGTRIPMESTDVVAWWDDDLSGADGTIASPPTFVITFANAHSTVGLTLEFDTSLNEWCSEVNIKWYNGATLLSDVDFEPESAQYFCANTVNSFNKIELTLNKTDKPYRRAKLNRILFGIYRDFGIEQIKAAKVTAQCHLISAELPISKLQWTLIDDESVDTMFQFKQQVEVRANDRLLGVYYISDYKRTAPNIYEIECIDALGVLDTSNYAGVAALNATSAISLFNGVINGEYNVTYELADTNLRGVIAPCTKRQALQQILFAWGAVATTDGQGGIRVFALPTVATVKPTEEIYTEGTMEKASVVTQVNVTAHSYAQSSSGTIQIGTRKYADTPTVVTWDNPNVPAYERPNVVNVTNATLVHADYAADVAQRLGAYYNLRYTSKTKMVWTGERLGDLITLDNKWADPHTGHIKAMEMTISNVVAANTEAIG